LKSRLNTFQASSDILLNLLLCIQPGYGIIVQPHSSDGNNDLAFF